MSIQDSALRLQIPVIGKTEVNDRLVLGVAGHLLRLGGGDQEQEG